MATCLSKPCRDGVIMRMSVIGAIVLCILAGEVQAQTTTLTPLASYDAGENIVSYYRYVALDCPNAPICSHRSVLTTPGRAAHKHIAAVVTGFRLWVPVADNIGKIAVRVDAASAGNVGQVNLSVLGLFETKQNQKFSYEVTVAVIESTIEGFLLTKTHVDCGVGVCPKPFSAAGAVPPGWTLVGFGLAGFDSDRKIAPLWGAVALPIVKSIDPVNGDVSATMHCGTVQKPGVAIPTVSGPCETNWVLIAAHVAIANGPRPSGPPWWLLSPWSVVPASGINSPNPSSTTPGMVCAAHPRPSPGFLDALAGFYAFAGQFTGGRFTLAKGPATSLEMNVSSLGLAAPGVPQVTYSAGLTVSQVVVPSLPPAVVPLTYVRASTLVCL